MAERKEKQERKTKEKWRRKDGKMKVREKRRRKRDIPPWLKPRSATGLGLEL